MTKKMSVSGHAEDCESDTPFADRGGQYTDIFCNQCHDWFDEPHVLPNGTDIAWPANWTQKDADHWRSNHRLARAGTNADLANPVSTAGTGMLPDPDHPSDDDAAPGG